MHVADAAYSTVHDYPGGAGSLAPRLGTTQGVLNSKINPNTPTHHLTLAEAAKLVVLTGDTRIVHALALEAGGVFIEGAALDPSCDMAVVEGMSSVFAKVGDSSRTLHEALADGRLTRKEFKAFERAQYAARQALAQLTEVARRLKEKEPGCA